MDSCAIVGCNENPGVLVTVEYEPTVKVRLLVCNKHHEKLERYHENKITVEELE